MKSKKIYGLTILFFIFISFYTIKSNAATNTSTGFRYPNSDFENVLNNYPDMQGLASWGTIPIPGLEKTDTCGDVCTDMVPQGICIVDKYVLITEYCYKEQHNSVIQVMTKGGKYIKTIVVTSENGEDVNKNHFGGITYDGENIWIARSYDKKLQRISKNKFLELIEESENYSIELKPDSSDLIKCGEVASFVTYYDGYLWVGSFKEKEKDEPNPRLHKFKYENDELIKIAEIVIPELANGAAFAEINGKVCLAINCSYGRKNDSEVYFMEFEKQDFENNIFNSEFSSHEKLTLPPLAEELCISNNIVYYIFESAATEYSTNILNKCPYVIDRVCEGEVIDLFSWMEEIDVEQPKLDMYQTALWFMDDMKITQVPDGDYSHKGTQNFDVVGVSNNNIKAPFDCKVVAIYDTENSGNTVVIQSNDIVHYADGSTQIMSMAFAHDNDISDLWVGKEIKQGEVFYQTGNYGNATGVHSHVTCIRGEYQHDMFSSANEYGNWCSPNAIAPTSALFISESTNVIDSMGLTFEVYKTINIKLTQENEYGKVRIEWDKPLSKYRIAGVNTDGSYIEGDYRGDIGLFYEEMGDNYVVGYIKPGKYYVCVEEIDDYYYPVLSSNLVEVNVKDKNVMFKDEKFYEFMISKYDTNKDEVIQVSEIPVTLSFRNDYQNLDFEDSTIVYPENINKITKVEICDCGNVAATMFEGISKQDSIQKLTITSTGEIDNINELLGYFTFVEKLSVGSRYYPQYGTSVPLLENYQGLANYKNLKELSLEPAITSEDDMNILLQCKDSLEVLSISGVFDQKQYTDLSKLSEIENLKRLYLNNTSIDDCSFVNNMPKLKNLELNNVYFSNDFTIDNNTIDYFSILDSNIENVPNMIGNMQNLRELWINGENVENNASNFKWNQIKNLTKLEYLNICSYQIDNFDFLKSLVNLEELSLTDIEQGNIIPSLNELLNLKRVSLTRTNFKDISGLADLAILDDNNLERLSFWENSFDPCVKENLKLFEILNRKQIEYQLDKNIELPDYTSDKVTVTNVTDENGNEINTIRIKHSTQVNKAIIEENFPILKSYDIYVAKPDGTVSKDTTKIGSKDKIEICNTFGEVVKEYTVIVPGDVSGDGEVKIYDAFNILKGTISNTDTSNNIERMIRDYNDDGKVKVYDAYSFLKYAIQ